MIDAHIEIRLFFRIADRHRSGIRIQAHACARPQAHILFGTCMFGDEQRVSVFIRRLHTSVQIYLLLGFRFLFWFSLAASFARKIPKL